MSNILKISEAASLAFHTMVLLVAEPEKLFSAKDIATELGASKDHLSKVLQRLEKAGFLEAIRGPKGGYRAGKIQDVTLLDIYEIIEGKLSDSTCLLRKPVCDGNKCILGGILNPVNKQVRDYLSGKKLADLAILCKDK